MMRGSCLCGVVSFEVALSRMVAGSTLGFWCPAYRVPNTAIVGLRNILLGVQLSDAEHYDLRLVIDGQRFDLRGIARDGEFPLTPTWNIRHHPGPRRRVRGLSLALPDAS